MSCLAGDRDDDDDDDDDTNIRHSVADLTVACWPATACRSQVMAGYGMPIKGGPARGDLIVEFVVLEDDRAPDFAR